MDRRHSVQPIFPKRPLLRPHASHGDLTIGTEEGKIWYHPDDKANLVLQWHLSQTVAQAVGRPRPLTMCHDAVIDYVGRCPLPAPVHVIGDLQDYLPRIDDMLATVGLVPESPEAQHALAAHFWPVLFPTAEAVQDAEKYSRKKAQEFAEAHAAIEAAGGSTAVNLRGRGPGWDGMSRCQ